MLHFKSPAKINLHLRVLGKRGDGYHDVATILHTIDLSDDMSFRQAERGIHLHASGYPLPEDENNLAYRAAALLMENYGPAKGVYITLKKRIPVAAGLGGGSSNAATTLLALNRLWNLNLSQDQLHNAAAALGSDVPFFLNGPAAVGRGRGEILSPIPTLGSLPLVLVIPQFKVTTAWAYANLNLGLTKPGDDTNIIQTIISTKKIEHWASLLQNDLEAVVIRRYPIIEQMKAALKARGAEVALMSGSGPAVFGLFKEKEVAGTVADALQGEGKTVILTRTLSRLERVHNLLTGL